MAGSCVSYTTKDAQQFIQYFEKHKGTLGGSKIQQELGEALVEICRRNPVLGVQTVTTLYKNVCTNNVDVDMAGNVPPGKQMFRILKNALSNTSSYNEAKKIILKQRNTLRDASFNVVGDKKVYVSQFPTASDFNDKSNSAEVRAFKKRYGPKNDTITIFSDALDKEEGKRTKLQTFLAENGNHFGIPLSIEKSKSIPEDKIEEAKQAIDVALNELKAALKTNKKQAIDLPHELGPNMPLAIAEYLKEKLASEFGIHYEVEPQGDGTKYAKLVSLMQTHGNRVAKQNADNAKSLEKYQQQLAIAQEASAISNEYIRKVTENELTAFEKAFPSSTRRMEVHNFFSRGFSSILDKMLYDELNRVKKKKAARDASADNPALTDVEFNLLKAEELGAEALHRFAFKNRLFSKDHTTVHAVFFEMDKILKMNEREFVEYCQKEVSKILKAKREGKSPNLKSVYWFIQDYIDYYEGLVKSGIKNPNTKLTEFVTASAQALSDVFLRCAANINVRSEIWQLVSADLYLTENINVALTIPELEGIRDRKDDVKDTDNPAVDSISQDNQADLQTESGEEDPIGELQRSGDFYLIKMREIDPEDTLTTEIRIKLSQLFQKSVDDPNQYTYDSLGQKQQVASSAAFSLLLQHFSNLRGEKDFNTRLLTAIDSFPWFTEMGNQMIEGNPEFDEMLRNSFYSCLDKAFNKSAMISAKGIVTQVNGQMNPQNLKTMIQKNQEAGTILTEAAELSFYGTDGQFNQSNAKSWVKWVNSHIRALDTTIQDLRDALEKEGEYKKDNKKVPDRVASKLRSAKKTFLEQLAKLGEPKLEKKLSTPAILELLHAVGISTEGVNLDTVIPQLSPEQQQELLESPEKFSAVFTDQKIQKILNFINATANFTNAGRFEEMRKRPIAEVMDSSITLLSGYLSHAGGLYQQSSYLYGGKTKQSYTARGFVDDLNSYISLSGQYSEEDVEYGDTFIQAQYLSYDFFIGNPIINLFMGKRKPGEPRDLKLLQEMRQNFSVTYLQGMESSEDEDDFDRVSSDKLIWYTTLAFFASTPGEKIPGGYTHYRGSLLSDSGKQVMYKLPVFTKEECLNHLVSLADAELDRMLEAPAPKNGEVEFYENNKGNFCFLPRLNPYKEELLALKKGTRTNSEATNNRNQTLLKDRLKELIDKEIVKPEFALYLKNFREAARSLKHKDAASQLTAIENVINKVKEKLAKGATTDEVLGTISDEDDENEEGSEQEVEVVGDDEKTSFNLYLDEEDKEPSEETKLNPLYYHQEPFQVTAKDGKNHSFHSVAQYVVYRRIEDAPESLFIGGAQGKQQALADVEKANNRNEAWEIFHNKVEKNETEQDSFEVNEELYIYEGTKAVVEQKPEIKMALINLGNASITVTNKDDAEVGNGVIVDAVNRLREELGHKPRRLGRTNNQIREQLREYLEKFFYNDYTMQATIVQLTGGDLAFYKNFTDFVKRNKQCYSAGPRGYAMDENGNPIMENSIYIKDFTVFSTSLDQVHELLKQASQRGDISSEQGALILGAVHAAKKICSTDGFSLRTTTGFRKLLRAMGQLTPVVEKALDRIENGKMQKADLWNIFNQIKPFVMTSEAQQRGSRNVKIINQRKNSEYLLGGFIGMLNQHFNKSPELTALFNFCKKHNIDTIHNHSVIKVGFHHPFTIDHNEKLFQKENPGVKWENFVESLGNAVLRGTVSQEDAEAELERYRYSQKDLEKMLIKKTFVDPAYIHQTPLADIMMMQPSSDHLTDAKAKEGSQFRNIIVADLPETIQIKLPGSDRVLGKQEILTLWNALHAYSMSDGYSFLQDILDDPQKFSNYLQEQVAANKRYNQDTKQGMQVINEENTDQFFLPANTPAMVNKVNSLILSLSKKNIQEIKLPGGQATLISDMGTGTTTYGLSDKLSVEWEEDENGNKKIKAFQCLVPPYSKELIKTFGKKDPETGYWTLDVKELEETNPDLLKAIGYRIPTEAKYSMVPLKIVGFLPGSYGASIMLPADIIYISGTDFDIDKLFLMLKHIRINHYKEGWNAEKEAELFAQWQEEEMPERLRNEPPLKRKRAFRFAKGPLFLLDKPEAIIPTIKITEGVDIIEAVKNASKEERENAIFDLAEAILTSPEGSQQVMQGATYENVKKSSRQQQILENAQLTKAFIEKYGDDALFDSLNRLTLDELQKFVDANAPVIDPLSINTYKTKHRNLMDGNALIGVFAVNMSSHLKFQNLNLKVNPANQFIINGRKIEDFDRMIDPKTGMIISQICAQFQAASPDNGKDPTLGDLGITFNNASFTCALTRLGFKPEEIGLINRTESLANSGTAFRGQFSADKLKDVLQNFNCDLNILAKLRAKKVLGQDFTDEEKLWLAKYSIWRSNLSDIAADVRLANSFDRVDSPSAALPTSEAGIAQMVVEAQGAWARLSSPDSTIIGATEGSNGMADLVDLRLAEKCNFDEDLIRERIMQSPVPRIQAAWTYGIEMSSALMAQWLPNLNIAADLLDELQNQTKRNFTGKSKLTDVKKLLTAYIRYNLSLAPIFCGENKDEFLKRRNYYINKYPQKLHDMLHSKNPTSFEKKIRELDFFKNLQTGKGVLKIKNINGIAEQTRALFKGQLQDLITEGVYTGEEEKEAQQLFMDLFAYSYFENGNFFGHSSIGPFFSTITFRKVDGYLRAIREGDAKSISLHLDHVKSKQPSSSESSPLENMVLQYLLNNPEDVFYAKQRYQTAANVTIEMTGPKGSKKSRTASLTLSAESPVSNPDFKKYFLTRNNQPLSLIRVGKYLYKYVGGDITSGKTWSLKYERINPLRREGVYDDITGEWNKKDSQPYEYYDANTNALDINTSEVLAPGDVYNLDAARKKLSENTQIGNGSDLSNRINAEVRKIGNAVDALENEPYSTENVPEGEYGQEVPEGTKIYEIDDSKEGEHGQDVPESTNTYEKSDPEKGSEDTHETPQNFEGQPTTEGNNKTCG